MVRVLLVSLLLLCAATAAAAPDEPAAAPALAPSGPRVVSAESRVNDGLAFAKSGDWVQAETAYRDATRLGATLPEAWNGLGFALRKLGRYDESIRAYHEALRLRPAYPQALEYLGEAYVQVGRLQEARAILERLRPLDPKEADELAQAIAKAVPR